MVQPVQNLCTPSNIYGGFTQTLFLGCSISSFSASAAFNEQGNELTVQLVQDTCASPDGRFKRYYDDLLQPQEWTAADPGFYGLSLPIIGAPAYFRVADFEFSGLIQSWEQANSESGNPVYTVKLTDPRGILENAQLLINEYAGSVADVPNLINVFGFMESYGGACVQMYQSAPGTYSAGSGGVDGTVFGSPAEAYGGAASNDNGTQWNQILAATRLLLSAVPPTINQWSPYGRLMFKAPNDVDDGMGLMIADDLINSRAYYLVDLNEVPTAPEYWRLQGADVSLMDAISSVCADAGMDYYVELIPVIDDINDIIVKFIKVRTVDRNLAPALNNIDTFIDARDGYIVNYNKGRELRNEPTSSFVIGGPKQSFYQAFQNLDPEGDGQPAPPEADDMIVPYFGVDPDSGNVLLPTKDVDGFWEVTVPSKDLAQTLSFYGVVGFPDTVLLTENEIIAATIGYDMWVSYASGMDTELFLGSGVNIKGLFSQPDNIGVFIGAVQAAGGKLAPGNFVRAQKDVFPGHGNKEIEVAQACFQWINKFASEYYGRTFQVRVPWVCGQRDGESDIILKSEEPSDGGWTEVATVLGLANPGLLSDFFRLDDNRLGAFCAIEVANEKELQVLSPDDYVVDVPNNILFTKVSVAGEYVYADKETSFSPRAVISLPNQIKVLETDDEPANLRGLAELLEKVWGMVEADAQAANQNAQKKAGGHYLNLAWLNRPYMPDAVGFGIKSNVLTYGPWGSSGPAGGVRVTHDEGLVPWEYGGFTTLDLAGLSKATEGVTNVQVTEEGSITVVGYPDLPLGSELLAADAGGPFAGGTGTNLVENRSLTTTTLLGLDYLSTGIYPWTGSFGPNITGLTTTVSTAGLTTTYSMRTWTPKFGRFQKGNADRIKKIGQQRLSLVRKMRAKLFQNIKHQTIRGLGQQIAGANIQNAQNGQNLGNAVKQGTPHSVLVGQINPWVTGDDIYRTDVSSQSLLEFSTELLAEYEEKSIMSLDGLIRPVSNMVNDFMPNFAVPNGSCQKTHNRGAQPPVGDTASGGVPTHYKLDTHSPYMNPWANPSSDVSTRSNTSTIGHDIEILARTTGADADQRLVQAGYQENDSLTESDYQDDYRGFALKGPMLLSGWGYDTDGFPIPNIRDTGAGEGNFPDGPLEHKFADNWLRNPKSWPTGPVDLKFDRQRGVWTIPQYRDLFVQITECILPYSSGLATVFTDYSLYDSSGSSIASPKILVTDLLGGGIPIGKAIVRYNPATCVYNIVERLHKGKNQDICVNDYTVPDNVEVNLEGDFVFANGIKVAVDDVLYPCIRYLTAGIIPSSFTECVTGGTPPDYTGATLYSKLAFGNGMSVIAGDDDCQLKIGAGFVVARTGDICISTQHTSEHVNKIYLGNGIRSSGVGCGMVLDAGIEIAHDSTCVSEEDPMASVNKLTFGRGLYAISDGDGTCAAHIGAGFQIANDGVEVNIANDLPGEADLPHNKLIAGKGILIEHAGDCDARIGLGFCIDNDNECVEVADIDTACGFNTLIAGRGTLIEDAGNNQARIGSGINISHVVTCVTGTDNANYVNAIKLGLGLYAEVGVDCDVTLGAGTTISNDSVCVTGVAGNTNAPINNLIGGRGILISNDPGVGSCSARIGLNLTVDGFSPVAEINFSDCFNVTNSGCSVSVEPKYTGISSNVDVVTGISSFALSGLNLQIVLSRQRMQFSPCGTLTGVVSISNITGTVSGTDCD